MADFDKYAPVLKYWEGGFVNDPTDRGGATNQGVTLTTFRETFGQGKTVEDLKNMTYDQWRQIMKGRYWDKCKADQINNQSVADQMVDWCINAGTGMIRRIQAALGLEADGIVGPITINYINNHPECAHCRTKRARKEYYEGIIAKNPSQSRFRNGWFRRIDSFTYSE